MTKYKSSEFLLKEYDRISEAHFNTSNQISSFFRYYLTIMSVPSILVIYSNDKISLVNQLFDFKINFILRPYLGLLFIIISLIGLALTFYLIKLKFEHILYARTVNGIRNYFSCKDENLDNFLVLPTNKKIPSFISLGFGSLVFVNGLVNSGYLLLGLLLLNYNCYLLIGIFYLLFHVFGYLLLSYFEEDQVLKLKLK